LKNVPIGQYPRTKPECNACHYARAKQWRKDNPEKYLEQGRQYAAKRRARDPELVREQQQRFNRENPERVLVYRERIKRAKFKRVWGIDIDDIPDHCEVCGEEPVGKARMCVDHDHDTGAFRGYLCALCNSALGMAKDDPAILRALAAYVDARTS
jgi:hypothetical protein